ncbi:hypothetical protein C8R45DRAFT_995563 [Mycena sanguinolenta]|nr:hypothetical protein C8R45DRAFT_995563 [Mycena sanguinolenta]
MYADYCLSCGREVDDGGEYCNECQTTRGLPFNRIGTKRKLASSLFEFDEGSSSLSHLVAEQSHKRGDRLRSPSGSSDGQGSSWLSGLSDVSSNPSSRSSSVSSFSYHSPSGPSSPRKDWNRPAYDIILHQQLLADLDLTGSVAKLDQYPFECGGAADLYRGILSPRSGPVQQVAVKVFRRMHSEPKTLEQTCKSLYREARIWKRLIHPNILPFLGISLDLGLSPALISPLCESGHIMKYLHNCSEQDEKRHEMAIGVASGLAYLNSQGIVHGNLCTKKILINAAGSPVICGYGMSKTTGQAASATSLFTSSIRFTAPECFSDKGNVTSAAADIYSLSMVTLEIISGLQPYHELPAEHAIFMHVIRGGRPSRTHLDKTVITSRVWKFLVFAWNQEPSMRPDAAKFLADLIQIRRFHDLDDTEEINEAGANQALPNENEERSSSGEEIFFGDMCLPDLHGRDLTGRVLQDDKHPFAGGGNANIYRGKLIRSDGRKIRVAIKLLRVSEDANDVMRRLRREVEVWSKLKHKNVLPFIGVCNDIAPYPVLISPFYKFGHVETYVKKNPSVNKHALVHGVASGLQYLHENNIVHGDLKVQNVLVDKRGAPCICDFGISKIVNHRGFTTFTNGTTPYMAPELFFIIDAKSQDSASPSTTKQSDVYSFALLALEILTSAPPKGRPKRPILTVKTLEALRPKRADYNFSDVPNEMWSVLDRCWAFVPQWRPTISEVLDSLLTDEFPVGSSIIRPIPTPAGPGAKNRLVDPKQRSRFTEISDSSSDDSQRSWLVRDDSRPSLLLQEAYKRLNDVLPVHRGRQSRICLLDRANDHIQNLDIARDQLKAKLNELERHYRHQVLLHEGLCSRVSSAGCSYGHFVAHLTYLHPSSEAVQMRGYNSQQQLQGEGPSLQSSLSAVLSRPLTAQEADRLADLDRLRSFLATAPSRWEVEGEDSSPHCLAHNPYPASNSYSFNNVSSSPSAYSSSYGYPNNYGNIDPNHAITRTSHPALNRFLLPSQEHVSCVLWDGSYYISGTDIVRLLVFRFEAFSRPVRDRRKFEEGVFSDLRKLKPGVDACLEEPKSPFLDLLYKYQCIRTQKKQKVFYWFSVPHDRLFLDALERDLKREKLGLKPTTEITGEPALSFTYDDKKSLYEQFVANSDVFNPDEGTSSPASSRNASVFYSSRNGVGVEARSEVMAPFIAMFLLFKGKPPLKGAKSSNPSGAPPSPGEPEEAPAELASRSKAVTC